MTAFRFAARSIHAEIQLLGRRNKFVSPFDTRREYFPIPSPSLTFNYRQNLNLFPGLDNTGRISPNPRITRLATREAEIYERKRDRVDELNERKFLRISSPLPVEGMLARVGNDLVPNCSQFDIRRNVSVVEAAPLIEPQTRGNFPRIVVRLRREYFFPPLKFHLRSFPTCEILTVNGTAPDVNGGWHASRRRRSLHRLRVRQLRIRITPPSL